MLSNLPHAFLMPTGIVTYFLQSNTVGQIIVILLIVASLLAWTVMIGKYLDLSRLQTLNASFGRKIDQTASVLGLGGFSNARQLGPYAVCVQEATQAARRHQPGSTTVTRLRMGHVENALQRAVARETIRYEDKMVTLGSIVSGAPFMGLLGTVWGVMDAFGSLAQTTNATIQNLAPGVSGALLTTVAGLFVAIPSVFGYNFLLSKTRLLVTELENFASTLADRIELEIEAEQAQAPLASHLDADSVAASEAGSQDALGEFMEDDSVG